jgi:hypothetical protein
MIKREYECPNKNQEVLDLCLSLIANKHHKARPKYPSERIGSIIIGNIVIDFSSDTFTVGYKGEMIHISPVGCRRKDFETLRNIVGVLSKSENIEKYKRVLEGFK